MKTIASGLPYETFQELRAVTALNRLNQPESEAIFEKLAELGFKVVPTGK